MMFGPRRRKHHLQPQQRHDYAIGHYRNWWCCGGGSYGRHWNWEDWSDERGWGSYYWVQGHIRHYVWIGFWQANDDGWPAADLTVDGWGDYR